MITLLTFKFSHSRSLNTSSFNVVDIIHSWRAKKLRKIIKLQGVGILDFMDVYHGNIRYFSQAFHIWDFLESAPYFVRKMHDIFENNWCPCPESLLFSVFKKTIFLALVMIQNLINSLMPFRRNCADVKFVVTTIGIE